MLIKSFALLAVLMAPLALVSCALENNLYGNDDDPAAGYRGIGYEKDVLAGRRNYDPYYMRERPRVFIPPPAVVGYVPSFASRDGGSASTASHFGTTYSGNYTSTTFPGGGGRVRDREGNSITYKQHSDGSISASSSTGVNYQARPTFGGGYHISGTDGSSYTSERTPSGTYQFRGSDGRVYAP